MKNWLGRLLTGIFISALVLGVTGQVFASSPGDEASGTGERKIVIFKDGVNFEADHDKIVKNSGATKVKHLALINGAVVIAGPASKKALEQMDGVLRVDDDVMVHTPDKGGKPGKGEGGKPDSSPAEVLPWGVDRIDADLVWDQDHDLSVDPGSISGAGVKVAVIDTGIDLRHPDLQANIKGGINTINPMKSPKDDNGHGTHVAGIIAGVDNTTGILGVAPNASLYAVKVLNASGSGYLSDIIEGIQWSIDNGMQVINMSLGTSSDAPALHDALIAAYNAGIVLVAAAGNSGPGDGTVLYPAKYPEVIAVSATDGADTISGWSSRGPEVELAAPGANIYSAYKGGGYSTLSGTSMASPHVAGAAALVVASGVIDSNGDGRVNDEVRARLQSTADDKGALGNDNLYGYGLVDAEEATIGVSTLP